MKTIGLLGGTHWISTIEYYRIINQKINETLGKNHSAKIILNSIDYETIKKFNYKNWDKIGDILMEEIIKLDSFNVDCILICNNVLHKAYDEISQNLYIDKPVIHIVDSTASFAQKFGYKNCLLLGTKFVMEDNFYKKRLAKFNIKSTVPNEKDRNKIQKKLQNKIFSEETKQWFKELINKHKKMDAVILGCTELPIVIDQKDYQIPILNTLELQCEKAVKFSIDK